MHADHGTYITQLVPKLGIGHELVKIFTLDISLCIDFGYFFFNFDIHIPGFPASHTYSAGGASLGVDCGGSAECDHHLSLLLLPDRLRHREKKVHAHKVSPYTNTCTYPFMLD